MKKEEVELGGTYTAKISDKIAKVRIVRPNPFGGWDAKNLSTDRWVRIKTAAKLRQRCEP
jgi:hypothetical protein